MLIRSQNDALQWMVEKAVEMGNTVELDPDRLTRRLMRLNMVAIHTTSVTITNALLDLYSSPKVDEIVAALREECQRVLKQSNGQWNKTAVNELYRVDSTIKESMRVSSLGITGLMRKVCNTNSCVDSANICITGHDERRHHSTRWHPCSIWRQNRCTKCPYTSRSGVLRRSR